MSYSAWSVVFGEQPSAAKWNLLGSNDAHFYNFLGDTTTGFPVQIASTVSTAVATGSGTTPLDDTIPQIGEGNEFMTLAITPRSATNILVIQAIALIANSASVTNTMALHQDAVGNALAAIALYQETANTGKIMPLTHRMAAGTTSSITFRIRVGGSGAGTITFNGASAARYYSTITKSSMTITEYKA